MISHLREHLEALEATGWEYHSTQLQGLEVTKRILHRVLPGEHFDLDPMSNNEWRWEASTAIARALGILRNQEQILEFLGPEGPSMPVDGLHEVVWLSASALWSDGHYGAAVTRAAAFLNAHVQARSQRPDLSDKELVSQAFSPEAAKVGKPRLRWTGDVAPRTLTSMRDGLLHYAMGVSLAIRNPSAHEPGDMSKQLAVEQLAAMSLLARWVDECVLDAVAVSEEGLGDSIGNSHAAINPSK